MSTLFDLLGDACELLPQTLGERAFQSQNELVSKFWFNQIPWSEDFKPSQASMILANTAWRPWIKK